MKGDFSDHLDTPVVSEDPNRPPKRYVPEKQVRTHAICFAVFIGLAIIALAMLLRSLSCAAGAAQDAPCTCASNELVLIALVIAAGAIGGLIHAATSFVTFAGNRELLESWMFWLYLRAPIGMLLALLVYLAIRAGIFGDSTSGSVADMYRIAFFAGLSGLFSKQVADKLSDLVDNLFVPSKRPSRADALEQTGKPADFGASEPASSKRSSVRYSSA